MTEPINFDEQGNLFPHSPISLPLPEIKKILVYSDKRSYLWNQFAGYIKAMKNLLKTEKFEVWIDGSFTTQIADPRIITFCLCIESRWINRLDTKTRQKINQLIDTGQPPSPICQKLEELHHCRTQILLIDSPQSAHYAFTHPIYERKKKSYLQDKDGHPKGFMIYHKQKGPDNT